MQIKTVWGSANKTTTSGLHQIFYYFGDLFLPLAKTEITLERITTTKTFEITKKKS
jgi:hypothetical protein